MRALQEEDLEAAMKTIDPASEGYATTEAFAEELFATYDLRYELKELKVVSKSDREARVRFVQTTRKEKGPQFQNNEIQGEHVLHKVDGRWLIYDTVVANIRYLD